MFCMVGQAQPMAKVEAAHENSILGVGFHPNGHLLASCEYRAAAFLKRWVLLVCCAVAT
jgi:hypothetical protein